MRRSVAGQLAIAAYPLRDRDGSVVVPAPSGIAALDTAWIQAAHDLLPSTGGRVRLQPGTYVLDGSSSPSLTFSKPIALQGHGKQEWASGTDTGSAATKLTLDHATATALSITATTTFSIRDLSLVNNHATPPSAGAGIAVTGSGVSDYVFDNVSVIGFYRCVDVQQGINWLMTSSHIQDFVQDGLRIQNLSNPDFGDMGVTNTYFYRGPNSLTGAIGLHWMSSGGLRLESSKFNINGSPSADGSLGLYIAPAASVVTGDIFVVGCSIENFDYGIAMEFAVTSASSVSNIVIANNNILATTACASLAVNASGHYNNLAILGNVFTGGGIGLSLQNLNRASYGPNVYNVSGTALSVTTCTNSLQVANG